MWASTPGPEKIATTISFQMMVGASDEAEGSRDELSPLSPTQTVDL